MHKIRRTVFSKYGKLFPGILVMLMIVFALCFSVIGCTRYFLNQRSQKPNSFVIWKTDDFVEAVTASDNGLAIAAASGDVVKIWSVPSLVLSKKLRDNFMQGWALRFSPDGKHLAGGGANNGPADIYMWNVSSGAERWQAKHGSTIHIIGYSPDGSEVASVGMGKETNNVKGPGTERARIWNVLTGKLVATIDDIHADVKAIKFVTNDKLLLFEDTADNGVKVFRVKAFEVNVTSSSGKPLLLHTLKPKKLVTAIAISPSGNIIATGGRRNGYVTIWHLIHNDVTSQKLYVKGIITALTFSPDGKKLAIAVDGEPTSSGPVFLLIVDVEKNTVANSLQEESSSGFILSVAFVPHSDLIIYSQGQYMKGWNYGKQLDRSQSRG